MKLRNVLGNRRENLGQSVKRYLVGLLLTMGIYLTLIFLYLYPHRPIDLTGWFLLIFIGIPVSVLLEWLGGYIFSHDTGSKISSEKFSIRRLIVALFAFLLVVGTMALIWLIFGSFIRQHFV